MLPSIIFCSSAFISYTTLGEEARRRRRRTLARLEIAEPRHKVSFNVGNIARFISHIMFFFPEVDGPVLRALEPPATGLEDSVLLEFICICSVKTYFLCCGFQFLDATVP